MEDLSPPDDRIITEDNPPVLHGITQNRKLAFGHLFPGILGRLGITAVSITVIEKNLLVIKPATLMVAEGMADSRHGNRRHDVRLPPSFIYVPLGQALPQVVASLLNKEALE